VLKKYFSFSYLVLLTLLSCSGDDNGSDDTASSNKLTSLTISSSVDQAIVGESIFFSVVDNTGAVRTYEAKFYVNNNEISGNTHLFDEVGTFEVYATYEDITSSKIEITIGPIPIEFKKRVLVEDYTGTWCGWCPRISYAIEKLEEQTDDAVIVAAHQGDPMQFSLINNLLNAFNITGFPTAIINRAARWNAPEPNNIGQVTLQLYEPANIGIAINSSVDGNNLSIKTKVKIGSNYNSLRLVVYLVEDNLIYDQNNSTSYYGGPGVAQNFKHHNVLRVSLTSLFGDQIPNGNLGFGNVYEREFTYSIPSNYKKSNIKIVSFVTTGESTQVINVRGANVGDQQSIEQN
jgi:thiol-disulfide isomerase/thioredoxin